MTGPRSVELPPWLTSVDDVVVEAGMLDLLPAGAEFDCELAIVEDRAPEARKLLNSLYEPLGLPTDRLTLRPGIRLWTSDGGARTWLVVDLLVPGTRKPGGGWDVQLNAEAGRRNSGDDPAGARAPAIDRWAVELVGGLPDWLEPVE